MDDSRMGVFCSHSEFQRKVNARQRFWRVVRAFNEVSLLSPIVAINPDPLAKCTKLDVVGIHFLCDVELATRRALGHNPALLDQWQRLIHGDDVPNATNIIDRCSRVYHARQLLPYLYFRNQKQGRRREAGAA
jgi:hypothetical protein